MRLISVGNVYGVHEVFEDLFKSVVLLDWGDDISIKKDDVVLFSGGEDIWAGLYNQKPNGYNGNQEGLSYRDAYEQKVFNQAVEVGAGLLGVCRGSQLLCALSGGSLYQHVVNHGHQHYITTKEGESILVSSTHHQMMNPKGTDHIHEAWAEDILSNVHLVEGNRDVKVKLEPEVVYFVKTRALAMQYHPEFMPHKSRGVSYARELVSKYFLNSEE